MPPGMPFLRGPQWIATLIWPLESAAR